MKAASLPSNAPRRQGNSRPIPCRPDADHTAGTALSRIASGDHQQSDRLPQSDHAHSGAEWHPDARYSSATQCKASLHGSRRDQRHSAGSSINLPQTATSTPVPAGGMGAILDAADSSSTPTGTPSGAPPLQPPHRSRTPPRLCRKQRWPCPNFAETGPLSRHLSPNPCRQSLPLRPPPPLFRVSRRREMRP